MSIENNEKKEMVVEVVDVKQRFREVCHKILLCSGRLTESEFNLVKGRLYRDGMTYFKYNLTYYEDPSTNFRCYINNQKAQFDEAVESQIKLQKKFPNNPIPEKTTKKWKVLAIKKGNSVVNTMIIGDHWGRFPITLKREYFSPAQIEYLKKSGFKDSEIGREMSIEQYAAELIAEEQKRKNGQKTWKEGLK